MSEVYDSEIESKVKALVKETVYLPDDDEKVAILEEAVRLADTGRDIKLQYETRETFLRAAYFSGAIEKALVAFSWCLAQFDKYPGKFDEWMILWRYKWMINVISDFPEVSKEQIYQMLDEMAERYRKSGNGLRAVYKYRYRFELFRGNREEAIKHYNHAINLPEDELSDCAACELDEQVTFNIYSGKDYLALLIAKPILSGVRKCSSVPHRTLAKLLLPLLRLGQRDRAWEFHLQGYRLIEGNKAYLSYLSDHLMFLPLYGDLEKAALLLEKHYTWSEKIKNMHDRYLFYRAAWLFLDIMSESADTLELSLPPSFPLYDESGRYETRRLADWFKQEAHLIGEKFDRRNETDHFAQELGETLALKELKVTA